MYADWAVLGHYFGRGYTLQGIDEQKIHRLRKPAGSCQMS
jgi:hypothetical protein